MAYKPRKDIKVPESYIQKIRATKTKSAALAKYGDSTDPKMREALRRFYGSSTAPTALKDSTRTRERTLPKKSVAMKTVAQAKPSRTGIAPRFSTAAKSTKPTSNATMTMGSRTGGKITVNKENYEKNKAAFEKRTNRALTVASAIPVVRGGMAAKAAYSAAAKQVGVAKVKQGVKNKIATKGELSEARSMARGMVKDTAKLKSKTATTKAKTVVKSGASKASGADKIKNANAIRKASKAGK